MADTKFTGLTANATPLSTDIAPTINDPSGTPTPKKVTLGNLITKAHGLSDGVIKVATGVMTVITAPLGALVGDTDTQTISNKTLSSSTLGNSTVFGSSTGVSISATTGAITIIGIGNTNNEDLKIDLETTTNQWTFSSSTGVNRAQFSGINFMSLGVAINTTNHFLVGVSTTAGGILVGVRSTSANSNASASAGAVGISGEPTRSGTGTATDLTLIGVKGAPNFSGATGTQATVYGIYGILTNTGAGGTITDAYSVYGATPVATGTITNAWAGGFNGAVKMGTAGSVVGSFVFNNATSGTITLAPVTGALGSVTLSLPAATDTLIAKTTTDTLTNKRITKRVITAADATSVTPNLDTDDWTYQANTQAAGTLTINAPSGTPTNEQAWGLQIYTTNAQTSSWNAAYVAGTGLALPTTFPAGDSYYTFIYNTRTSKLRYTGTQGVF